MNVTWSDALEQIRGARFADLESLALVTGVPVATLVKIKYGQTKNPRVQTAMKLIEHYASQPADAPA